MNLIRFYQKTLPLQLLFLLSACSAVTSSGGTDSEIENGILNAISAVNDAISNVGGISDQSKKMGSVQPHSQNHKLMTLAPLSFGSDWTTSVVLDPQGYPGDTTEVSFKDYFGAHLDEDGLTRVHPSGPGSGDAHNYNALGRMKNSLSILCAIGVGMGLNGTSTDENGYPTEDMTFTFTQTFLDLLVSRCGFSSNSVSGMLGMELNATVTPASNEYDVKIHFDAFNQDYYYRSNASEINILTAERADSSGPTMRTIVAFDLITDVIRVDYASVIGDASSAGLEAHRLFYDVANDDGMIISVIGNADSDETNKDIFTIGGKPANGTQFSISGKFRNYQSHSQLAACVNAADGSMGTDGSRCTASSTTVVGANVDDFISGAYTDLIAHQTDDDWQSSVTDTKTLSWTDKTDMLTGAFK